MQAIWFPLRVMARTCQTLALRSGRSPSCSAGAWASSSLMGALPMSRYLQSSKEGVKTASSEGMSAASGAAEGSLQRSPAAGQAASLLHLQHLSLKSSEMVASPAVGSQWWVERSAVQMNGLGGGHASVAVQRENNIAADSSAAVQHIRASTAACKAVA